ncbi:Hypotetical protein [Gulosibacter molinativorax]|nr:Hypotetical protein [Gulosibacter molinativorax]
MFIVGAGIGFVLGARAGRERYEQIKRAATVAAESAPAQRAVDLAQRGTDAATDQLAKLSGRVSESSKEFESKVVHTAEELREELLRRTEDARTSLEEARTSAKEWVDHTKERSIEFQAQNVVAVGDMRAEALADLDDSVEDEMVDEGHADERNRRD